MCLILQKSTNPWRCWSLDKHNIDHLYIWSFSLTTPFLVVNLVLLFVARSFQWNHLQQGVLQYNLFTAIRIEINIIMTQFNPLTSIFIFLPSCVQIHPSITKWGSGKTWYWQIHLLWYQCDYFPRHSVSIMVIFVLRFY